MATTHFTHRMHTMPDAGARVRVLTASGTPAIWAFSNKPYACQRSSGAPPG